MPRHPWIPGLKEGLKEAATAPTEGGSAPHRHTLTRKKPFGGLRIAASRAEFNSSRGKYDAYRCGEHRQLYMLCPFHREKTPSCVWYPKRPGARYGSPRAHYYCYGCGAFGYSVQKLIAAIRRGHPPEPAWMVEEVGGGGGR